MHLQAQRRPYPQRLAGEPDLAVADNSTELYSSSPWGFTRQQAPGPPPEHGRTAATAVHADAGAALRALDDQPFSGRAPRWPAAHGQPRAAPPGRGTANTTRS